MDRYDTPDGAVGYIGMPAKYGRYQWAYKAVAAVLAACCIGLLIYSAVEKNSSTVLTAGGAAIGVAVVWSLMNHFGEGTHVYPDRLELINRHGVDAQVPRSSISGFHLVVPGGESRPYIDVLCHHGDRVKVLGSDRQTGTLGQNLFRPKHTAEEIRSLLEGWLLDGRYR